MDISLQKHYFLGLSWWYRWHVCYCNTSLKQNSSFLCQNSSVINSRDMVIEGLYLSTPSISLWRETLLFPFHQNLLRLHMIMTCICCSVSDLCIHHAHVISDICLLLVQMLQVPFMKVCVPYNPLSIIKMNTGLSYVGSIYSLQYICQWGACLLAIHSFSGTFFHKKWHCIQSACAR